MEDINDRHYNQGHPVGEPIKEYKRRWLAGMIASSDVHENEKRSSFAHIGLDYDSYVLDGIIKHKLPETATGHQP